MTVYTTCPEDGGQVFSKPKPEKHAVYYWCENWNKDPKCEWNFWEKTGGQSLPAQGFKKKTYGTSSNVGAKVGGALHDAVWSLSIKERDLPWDEKKALIRERTLDLYALSAELELFLSENK